jgi:excisionase family DNA binding protein
MSLEAQLRAILEEEIERKLAPVLEALRRLEQAVTKVGTPVDVAQGALLTTEQAADLMCVAPSTIRAWAADGSLTRHGTPRSLRFDRAELLALGEATVDNAEVDLAARVRDIARKHGAR